MIPEKKLIFQYEQIQWAANVSKISTVCRWLFSLVGVEKALKYLSLYQEGFPV